MRYSVALPGVLDAQLKEHLLRDDGQEDVIAATYQLSTGVQRTGAVIASVIPPLTGERLVHENASFTSTYVLRAASAAQQRGEGLVLLHSHPRGRGWQQLSAMDHETEADYERVARAVTSLPLLGMTLAGIDDGWSARFWFDKTHPTWCESVRSVSEKLHITWNDRARPAPPSTRSQLRTISAWGETTQASIARVRALVIGVGSVGLDVAQRLAATGLIDVGVMDFDSVELANLDRLIGATRMDARLTRSKVAVAGRLMRSAATASHFSVGTHEFSVIEPEGLSAALDYDVIFSCVDRPWPRAILNQIAYSDLIPVLDGGIAIETFSDGRMRGGIWRSHAVLPGRPCMVCLKALDLGEVSLDRENLLDDPVYIASAGRSLPSRQNVAALSASISASLLAQFVSLLAHPGGRGVPAGLRYLIAPHELEHSTARSGAYCTHEAELGKGDHRTPQTAAQDAVREVVRQREQSRPALRLRVLDRADATLQGLIARAVGSD